MHSVSQKLLVLLVILVLPYPLFSARWKWVMSFNSDNMSNYMKYPTSVYYDGKLKRYYVVDSGNNRLLSFDVKGNFISQFDAGGRLLWPYDMRKEGKSILWVVERGKNSLTYIDLKKRLIKENTLKLPSGDIVFPTRLEIKDGKIFLLDRSSGAIVVYDKNLNYLGLIKPSTGDFGGFIDFKIKDNKLWCLDPIKRKVYSFSLDGKEIGVVVLKGSVDFPISVEIDNMGYIYILDRHAGNIKVFGRDGSLAYTMLEQGEAQGCVYYPIQIVFDGMGRLLVVEEGNGRIEVFER